MRFVCIAAVLGVASLLFAFTDVGAATKLSEPFNKTFGLRAGGELQLRNVNGAVTVETWDRDEVRVEAEKKVRGDSDELVRKVMDATRIEVSETGDGLEITTVHPKRGSGLIGPDDNISVSVEYKVWVPRNARLDLKSVNGALHVQGVRGDLSLESTNGGIQVADAAGAVQASTTNGSIDVKLAEVPQGSDLSFATTNGGVVVHLPKGIRTTLDASTFNGQVSSDFEVAGETKSRRRVEGAINGGGGGSLKIRTTNGSIRLVEG